jgi:hypothetical protein
MRTRQLYKCLLISIPVLAGLFLIFSTPASHFSSRSWDSLFLGSNFVPPFYPNQVRDTLEHGDLALHSDRYELKKIRFVTDEWGYRNDPSVCRFPEVVVLGDSMAVGGALTQADTLSAQLSRHTSKCVRSFAGGKTQFALNTLYGLGMRPKWVVMALTQRTAGQLKEFTSPLSRLSYGAATVPVLNSFLTKWLGMRRNVYWNFRSKHGVRESVKRLFGSQSLGAVDLGQKDIGEMLYYGSDWSRHVSDEEIDHDIAVLNRFAAILEELGAKLMFTFVPNKSTVYQGEFTDADPDFGMRFRQKVGNSGFDFVDLFTPFREDCKNGLMNHHLDDTHWNARGVSTFVGIVGKRMNDVEYR